LLLLLLSIVRVVFYCRALPSRNVIVASLISICKRRLVVVVM